MTTFRCAAMAAVLGVAAPVTFAEPALGQEPRASSAGAGAAPTVKTVPGPQYDAGWLHRFFFGTRYRDLWTRPITAPVLDLDRFAGGLTPTETGGRRQTLSLKLKGADGREYAFRSVDKDPSRVLDTTLRKSVAAEIVRDQTSALHPMAGLIAGPILTAAGIRHANARLFVMPDSPRLGEFRAEFAGMLGLLEERPEEDAGFARDAIEVADTEELLEEIGKHPEAPVDARAFLTARILDFYLGDWDRHADQWRWALVEDKLGRRWIPIPRDRDHAFSKYDGAVLSLYRRQSRAELLKFSGDYASPKATTWVGRQLDRRFLTGLERPIWDSLARGLQESITDSVLREAVGRQPPEYARESARLLHELTDRRDKLHEFVMSVYDMMAGEVDIYGSDRRDIATVDRREDETTVMVETEGITTPIFRRRFLHDETREIRLYLGKGGDSAIVRGKGGPTVRIVGEDGKDRLVAADGVGGVRMYDTGNESRAYGGTLITRPESDTIAARDWGSSWAFDPIITGSSDLGLVVSALVQRKQYGFRQHPFAWQMRAGASYATGHSAFAGHIEIFNPLESSSTWLTFSALASGLEAIRFYGIGNGTTDDQPKDFYRVYQTAYEIRPGIRFGGLGIWRFDVGAALRYVETDPTDEDNVGKIVAVEEPFGTGDVGRIGLVASAVHDHRDKPMMARHGHHLRVSIEAWPQVWGDLEQAFGAGELALSQYWTPWKEERLTLVGRVGGRAVWGEPPFYELAFLGGSSSLRGYRRNRFAGDQSAYGSGEVRMRVARFSEFLPGEMGVFALGELGRVFSGGDNTKTWHRSLGGGVYIGLVDRAFVFLGGAAHSSEGTLGYFGIGFPD
jgi:hypothetical protein